MFLIMLSLQGNVFNARATVNRESLKEKLDIAAYGHGRKTASPHFYAAEQRISKLEIVTLNYTVFCS